MTASNAYGTTTHNSRRLADLLTVALAQSSSNEKAAQLLL
jgi:hypothetical protein